MQHTAVGEPWEKLAIDVTGPFPRSRNGFVYMFTVIDCFTKYAFAYPVRSHEASVIAKILVDKVFAEFGVPLQILSDQGAEFQGNLMTELCRILGIDKLRTSSYRAQSNGTIERFHRSLNTMLGKVVDERQKTWDEYVPGALAAYRATPHESTGYSPNMLVFGREVNTELDLAFGIDDQEAAKYDSYDHYVSALQDKLRGAYALAREALGRSVVRNKRYYDMRVKPQQFQPGTWVWLYSPRRYQGRCPKWQKMYSGPFLIIKCLGRVNLVIQRSPRSNMLVTHVDKVKKCLSSTPESWVTSDAVETGEGQRVGQAGNASGMELDRRAENEDKVVPSQLSTREPLGLTPIGGDGRLPVRSRGESDKSSERRDLSSVPTPGDARECDQGDVGRPRRDARRPARYRD